MCSVCTVKEGEIEGLVPIILRARPVRWVSRGRALLIVPASSVIPMLAHTSGPGAVKPASSGLLHI